MERLIARLERKLGGLAVQNLMLIVVAGTAIVWVLSSSRPESVERLVLDVDAVRHGEVWRLVTFLFIPPTRSSWLILIDLYFTWWIGSTLEQHWGPFKFNVYYLVGAVATIVGAIVGGPATNVWLNVSLILALATLFPDVVVQLMLVVPIKVKWLGIGTAAWMGYMAFTGDLSEKTAIAASVVNYALFFGGHWASFLRGKRLQAEQRARREALRPSSPDLGKRTCAICGAREDSGADIRVCSCEKCGGKQRALCLEHARNH
ncbi:MAG TPA: rhomboid family intramembrane serine protease [Polyangiaceae bacterium]|nr:rhomboid family intramembrane serine protease [Polyangiaceae bacterium]